jgi:uncharacterized protein Smg (DUF494 family)
MPALRKRTVTKNTINKYKLDKHVVKKLENTLNIKLDDILSKKEKSSNTLIEIPINSINSNSEYKVSFKLDEENKDIILSCTCGEKFNNCIRNKCKHITFILIHLLKNICKNDKKLSIKIDETIDDLEKCGIIDETKLYNINDILSSKVLSKNPYIIFPISSMSSSSEYEVCFKLNQCEKNINSMCTCGLKFNVGIRNKCKHISHIIYYMINKMSENDRKLREKTNKLITDLGDLGF